MRSRTLGLVVGLGLTLGATSSARAQSGSADGASDSSRLDGLAAVVELKGKRKHGADRLSRSLRRALADALGGLRSSRALHREQDRLQITQRERTKPSRLAEAARGVGADYLVFVRVVRKKRKQYEAKGYLIEAASGEIVHRDLQKYSRPSKQAGPAGVKLAQSVLAELTKIMAERAPAEPDVPEPIVAETPPPTVAEPPAPAAPPPPAIAAAPPATTTPPATATPETGVSTEPKAKKSKGAVALRIHAGAGAGLVRSYRLSAEAVSASDLSHSLGPQALLQLGAEVMLPTLGLGLDLQAAWRPVGYNVVVNDTTEEVSGLLIDARTSLRYHLALTERAGKPVELIPALGLRLGRASVESQSRDVLPNATLMAIFARVGTRLPYDEHLEFEGGVDIGVVASYSESPVTTGEAPGGITFGVDLGARYWFAERVGVGFDARFNLDRLSFSNRPTRAVTRDEQAGLVDAAVSITDVRTAASVLFRL